MFNPRKYLFVFGITTGIFIVAYLLAGQFYNERVSELRRVESNIGMNILELETQYALLADTACETSEESNPALIEEINNLSRKLSYLEEQRGSDDAEVVALKKYYSLLEIKDYLLLRERAKQCSDRPVSILYFYSNKGDCGDCRKMGFVLTSLREDYDKLHVYAFDYNSDLSVIESLKRIYHLSGKLPVIVVNRKPYYGYQSRDEIESIIPELHTLLATSTATSTTR